MEDLKKLKVKNWKETAKDRTVMAKTHTGLLCQMIPIPVSAGYKVWVLRLFACWDCGFDYHLVDGCLSLVNTALCVVRHRSLRRTDPSSRGVVSSVVCLSV